MSADTIDTGDHVHHAPSGEDWVVAYVEGDKLAWCGWPAGEANLAFCTLNLAFCTLIKKATPESRNRLLRYMANASEDDERRSYARWRLANNQSGEKA